MLRDTLEVILMIVITLVAAVVIAVTAGFASLHYKCNSYAEATGLETKVHGPFCFVKDNNTWTLIQESRCSRLPR